jgi:transposase
MVEVPMSGAAWNGGGEANGLCWIDPAGGRRRWSADQKASIVGETLKAGVKVSDVAARHGVAPNLLSTWRRRAMVLEIASDPGFVPVKIRKQATARASTTSSPGSSAIEIVLANATIRVARDTDPVTLAMVLTAVRGVR